MSQSEKTKKDNKITKEEIREGKGLAVVSYLIAPISYFAGDKKNKFIRFHAIQGMNIFITALICMAVVWIVDGIIGAITIGSLITSNYGGALGSFGIFSFVNLIFGLVGLAIVIIDILGIVYAAQGLTKEVPIFNKFKIIKK